MTFKLEERKITPRDLSNPLRCEHVYRILTALEVPLTTSELLKKTKISSGIYYNTIERNLLQLELIKYEERDKSRVVILTDKGKKLLEVLKDIGFSKISEIR
jgi:predicted transcriptional regulator